LTERREVKATCPVLDENARSDKSSQDAIESARLSSGSLSQFIAAPWSLREQIRDPEYGNHMKGLWKMTHRNHLEKFASGR
jgi:hypothetical protein